MGYLGLALLESRRPRARARVVREGGQRADGGALRRAARAARARRARAADAGGRRRRTPAEPPPRRSRRRRRRRRSRSSRSRRRTLAPAHAPPAVRRAVRGRRPTLASPSPAGAARRAGRRPARSRPGAASSRSRCAARSRVRLDGLFAAPRPVALAGEMKRFRGRTTEHAVRRGRDPHAPRERGGRAPPPRGGAAASPRSSSAARPPTSARTRCSGSTAAIAFENGRVPSSAGRAEPRPPARRAGAAARDARASPSPSTSLPARRSGCRSRALVGWTGALTPRLGALADDADGAPVAVELAGEGRVLADPGKSDWGSYQTPGAFEAMQTKACTQWRGTHLVEGAGHWVQQEQPEDVSKLLIQFLRG